MHMGKEYFYLFLDIDGVLWDWKWRMGEIKSGNIKKSQAITQFNPQSIEALNTLIEYIDKDFICNLVISSSWRTFFEETKQILSKNGVKFPALVSKTPIIPKPHCRGKEILKYLVNKNDSQNVLIIDDETKDIEPYFSDHNIIKTDIYSESLRQHHATKWINQREYEYLDIKK